MSPSDPPMAAPTPPLEWPRGRVNQSEMSADPLYPLACALHGEIVRLVSTAPFADLDSLVVERAILHGLNSRVAAPTPHRQFRKKPVVISAWRADVDAEFPPRAKIRRMLSVSGSARPQWQVYDTLHDTWVNFEVGDWIIEGIQGEFYPCKPDIFDATYERVAAPTPETPSGAELIAAERQRQIRAEGWTDSHDDEHALGEMVTAALCYAVYASNQTRPEAKQDMTAVILSRWPWAHTWWKPSADPIRNLTKAGALIAAEIDRLQRLAGAVSHPHPEGKTTKDDDWRNNLRLLVNRLSAIREEARTPKRDFNLDWQLGRLLDQLERLAQLPSSDLEALAHPVVSPRTET